MMRRTLELIVLAALLCLPAGSAWAGGGGGGGICVNPGGTSGCFSTIQAGVNAAPAGGTVVVWNGFYNEAVTIPATKTGLTLTAYSRAVLDPEGLSAPGIIILATDVIIRGLTIQNGTVEGIEVGADRALLDRVHISGAESDCVEVQGVEDVTIQHSTLKGCGSDAVEGLAGSHRLRILSSHIELCDSDCIDISSSDDVEIHYNLVRNAADTETIDLSSCDGAMVTYNEVEGSDGEGIECSSCDDFLALGNRLFGNKGGIDVNGENPVVKKNVIIASLDSGDGIEVDCDTDCSMAEVSQNRVEVTVDATGEGIDVDASAPGTLVAFNLARGIGDDAFRISGAGKITVRWNNAREVGSDGGEDCFLVQGTGGHMLMNNRADECHGHAYDVSGDDHVLDGNSAFWIIASGVNVQSGSNRVEVKNSRLEDLNGVGVRVEGSANDAVVTGNVIRRPRHGLCDEGTGTTLMSNSVSGADLPDQIQTAMPCPIDD